MAHMSRVFEQTVSTAEALEKTAERYGVKEVRTVQKAREEYPPITTQAELFAAIEELGLADEAGLLSPSASVVLGHKGAAAPACDHKLMDQRILDAETLLRLLGPDAGCDDNLDPERKSGAK
jgi:hypothetical protein